MNTDPIADLLTRIRNANMAGLSKMSVPSSKAKKNILQVMKDKDFIKDFTEVSGEKAHEKSILVSLSPERKLYLKRISKPGQRIYKKAGEIYPVVRGYGISIVSTSQGVMTGDDARKMNIGGEVLCEIH
ncbi:MAG: 30S ribosomal protein S8 [Candidatus Gracilibacteria bacterium]|nr:30S ribosomal protein S8 [Candidatus Gracilibacteria bacterium]